MKSFSLHVLIVGVICTGILVAGPLDRTLAAGDDAEQQALEADHSLVSALGKADKSATGKLLDADFVWTDADGKSLKKAKVLGDLPTYAADNQGDENVQSHFYGQMETVLGVHHNARFLRVWVKRAAGWREFVDLDTPISTRPAPGANSQRCGIGVSLCFARISISFSASKGTGRMVCGASQPSSSRKSSAKRKPRKSSFTRATLRAAT